MSVYSGKLICSDKRQKKKYNNALCGDCVFVAMEMQSICFNKVHINRRDKKSRNTYETIFG